MRGLGTLETLLLISAVTVSGVMLTTWLLHSKPSVKHSTVFLSIETIAKSSSFYPLYKAYGGYFIFLNDSNKTTVFKPSYNIVKVNTTGNLTIVAKVMLGSGCVSGVVIEDLAGNTLVIKNFKKRVCLKVGDVLMVNVTAPIQKFGKVRFFGPSNVRNLNTWMTQVR